MTAIEADKMVIIAHKFLPKTGPTVSNRTIDRCQQINVGTGRGHSKRKRLNEAIQKTSIPLLKQHRNGREYEILNINYERLVAVINDHGG